MNNPPCEPFDPALAGLTVLRLSKGFDSGLYGHPLRASLESRRSGGIETRSAVLTAPAGRRMDLADNRGVGMLVVRPERSFVLCFDDFRLEEQSRW